MNLSTEKKQTHGIGEQTWSGQEARAQPASAKSLKKKKEDIGH